MKFIDLFCGIGGFHTALTRLGHQCVLASDKDKYCRQVYQMNYNIEPNDDVKKINPDDIEDFDIICAGFPCQPFSNAGKKQTFSDDRGLLFDEVIRLAKAKKPRFMFLENVKHILKVSDGAVMEYIINKLDEIGYTLQLFEMSPHRYGVPQQRERIYFICIRNDIYKHEDVKLIYPEIPESEIVFQDHLTSKEEVPEKYFINGDLLEVLNAWDEMIQIFDVDEKISPTILVNEFYNEYTDDEFKKLAVWRQDYITKNRPLYVKYKDQWDAWYEKHKEALGKREIYAKLEWQVGKIKPNDSIFNYFIQVRQSGIRVKKAPYFHTLVAISQIPIYGKEKRYITPKECLRLQSFPDDFQLLPEDKHSYKQLGNCVNVNNVTNVIESTLTMYSDVIS